MYSSIQSLFLPPFAPRWLAVSKRYYDGSDSSGKSHASRGLPTYLAPASNHSILKHPMMPGTTGLVRGRPAALFLLIDGEQPIVEDFAMIPLARHIIWPKQVHFITDWLFIFSCFPPHLAVTQFLSITDRPNPAREGLPPSCWCAVAGARYRSSGPFWLSL